MKFSANILLICTAIVGASAVPTTNTDTELKFTGGETSVDSVECTGYLPQHASCTIGQCQCLGNNGCYSCNGGRVQCQPGPGSGVCWTQ
ncbi:hypothetical protein N7478_000828 [Penicillium angulare]|uniref:uncharacterized protein n=1 Tax=Penicillium angulare TaxID=116970 RepID=UPI002541CF82|nr:uncharacterized protein N7478_000828 [Penicillium angulare]KAJ5291577.1 hypothetical protein N7478_000828 [Penicillium angulare]